MVTSTNNARHFKQGRGVYTCATCQRRTRETTVQGSDDCALCYDLAGLQNMVWDGNFEPSDANERDAILARIEKLGGNVARVRAAMPDLFKGASNAQLD